MALWLFWSVCTCLCAAGSLLKRMSALRPFLSLHEPELRKRVRVLSLLSRLLSLSLFEWVWTSGEDACAEKSSPACHGTVSGCMRAAC